MRRLLFPLSLALAAIAAACGDSEQELVSTRESPVVADEAPRLAGGPPHLTPMPDIPEALRGCWRLDETDNPGEAGSLTVAANTLRREDEGVPIRTARAEFVDGVAPDRISGRFSAVEGGLRVTVATGLELEGSGGGERLTLHEGDAGSYSYRRCRN